MLLATVAYAGAAVFTFDCPEDRYISKPVGQSHQFRAPLRGLQAGGHAVLVTFQPHVPGTWFAQWRQQSTGPVYFGDQQITLNGGLQDRLDIDIFPDAGSPGMGWVDVSIRAVEDPYEIARCTFTLFSGVPVPPVDFHIDCRESARWVTEPQYFEFHSPLVNHLSVTDTLMVTLETQLVDGWDMHFHHAGVCHLSYAECPIAPNSPDSIVIMCYVAETPGSSAADMFLQSKRNPSLVQSCGYRAYLQQPQGVEPVASFRAGDVFVVPNPSSREAAFLLRRSAAESGALGIFSADGRVVREFPRLDLQRGVTRVGWDGRDAGGRTVPPGIYFYRWLSGESVLRGTLVRTR
jgi:hypothetical protein